MDTSFQIIAIAVLLVILLADLAIVLKRPHVPSIKECAVWITFYVLLALVFAGILFLVEGHEYGTQFVAGWLTEYSLSVDNLFVFIIILSKFAVPRKYQQEVLMVGILIALVLRGIFILLGAAIIESFSWVFFIFGAFLLYTAWKQAKGDDEEDEGAAGAVSNTLGRFLPLTDEYDGKKIRTVVNGRKLFTPMLVVFVSLGFTDLMFAVDSIPAIFGLTNEAFIVFTANILALMGLRQLYFMLGGLMERLVYLHYGLASILAFIGLKLIIHASHEYHVPGLSAIPEIPTWLSLLWILVSVVVAAVASLARTNRASGTGNTGTASK